MITAINKMFSIYLATNLIVICVTIFNTNSIYALDSDDDLLKYYLELSQRNIKEKKPLERIIRKDEILFCTNNSKVATANNQAATLMQNGKYNEAILLLKKALTHAPLFYPFQYNLGKCYYHVNKLKRALLHLNKAKLVEPKYFLVYIQIGYVYEHQHKFSLALEFYRKAIRLYPKHLKSFILAGDLFYRRDQLEMATKYYDATLKINPRYANGILGRAKIKFRRKKYYQAYMMLKTIDTNQEYDKSLHYYFAECSYKLQDYNEAFRQYSKLLEFANDRFFLTTSISLIKHKQFLSERFANQIKETKE